MDEDHGKSLGEILEEGETAGRSSDSIGEAMTFAPAQNYSRSGDYRAIENEAKAIDTDIHVHIDPFLKRIYNSYRFGAWGMVCCLTFGLVWMFLFAEILLNSLGPAAEENAGTMFRLGIYSVVFLPPLLIIVLFHIRTIALRTHYYPLLERELETVFQTGVLQMLYRETMSGYANLLRENAELSTLGLMNLISLRVRNILFHRHIWLIPLLHELSLMRFRYRVHYIFVGMTLFIVIGYFLFRAGVFWADYPACGPNKLNCLSQTLFPAHWLAHTLMVPVLALSALIFWLGARSGQAIQARLKELLQFERYEHWDVKELVTNFSRNGDAKSETERSHFLEIATHDLTAFIAEHYYQNMKKLIEFRDAGGFPFTDRKK